MSPLRNLSSINYPVWIGYLAGLCSEGLGYIAMGSFLVLSTKEGSILRQMTRPGLNILIRE